MPRLGHCAGDGWCCAKCDGGCAAGRNRGSGVRASRSVSGELHRCDDLVGDDGLALARIQSWRWRVSISFAAPTLSVELFTPGGDLAANKQIELKPSHVPCAAAIELTAILLAAYVPEVMLRAATNARTPVAVAPIPPSEPAAGIGAAVAVKAPIDAPMVLRWRVTGGAASPGLARALKPSFTFRRRRCSVTRSRRASMSLGREWDWASLVALRRFPRPAHGLADRCPPVNPAGAISAGDATSCDTRERPRFARDPSWT